jgi:shikimate kinase
MNRGIVLIGPVRAGKSTLGRLLAQRLGLPQASLDQLRSTYYREVGYDDSLAAEIHAKGGLLALVFYRQLFEAHAIERLLAEHPNWVVDFGAGVYESDECFARVQRALAPWSNIILLLPSPEREESLRILHQRDFNPPSDLVFDYNAHALDHHTYYDLARHTVYTAGKTPEESCAEILRLIADSRGGP